MGRPLNKKNFGSDALSIKVLAKVPGAAEGYGFIVAQRGTHTFDVNVGGTVGRCKLVDKANGSLVDGDMVMHVRNTSSVKNVMNIKGRTMTLTDGTTAKWDFDAAVGGKVEMEATDDTFSAPVAPVITITTQPANASVTAPATATFTVVASVTPTAALTYQWKKGSTVIAGATSASYTTPATTSGDTGSFTVVVSSAGATDVTSAAATLTAA